MALLYSQGRPRGRLRDLEHLAVSRMASNLARDERCELDATLDGHRNFWNRIRSQPRRMAPEFHSFAHWALAGRGSRYLRGNCGSGDSILVAQTPQRRKGFESSLSKIVVVETIGRG